jgi:hypothetical protein
MGLGEQELKKLLDGRDAPPPSIVIRMRKRGGHELLITIELEAQVVKVQRRTPRYGLKGISEVSWSDFYSTQEEFFSKWEGDGYVYAGSEIGTGS